MFTPKPELQPHVDQALSELKLSTDTVRRHYTPIKRLPINSVCIQSSEAMLMQEYVYLKSELKKESVDKDKAKSNYTNHVRHIREQRKLSIELTLMQIRQKTSLKEVVACLHDLFEKNNKYTETYCQVANVTLGSGRLSVNLHAHIKELARSGGLTEELQRQEAYEELAQSRLTLTPSMTSK